MSVIHTLKHVLSHSQSTDLEVSNL